MTHAKRYLMVAAAISALALPTAAFGAAAYKGPVESGPGGVELSVVFRNHHPKRVKAFNWFNVPVPPFCAASGNFPVDMRVNAERRFHGHHSVPDTNYSATIHGRFRHHNKKVTGTLRLQGSFAGGCVDQDTGALHYVAHKTGG